MKPIAWVLICLVVGSQGRVLQPSKEALDIPVTIIEDKEPQALPLQAQPEEQVTNTSETESKTQLPEQPKPEPELESAEPELKTELPKIAEQQPESVPVVPESVPAVPESVPVVPESQSIVKAEAVEQPVEQEQDAVQPNLRQATQATPTQQSTTQPNFVQQLIQNSPIGQFLNQFNGNQQQQQQQQQVLADPAATAAPTVPGFLNPGAAITSAQTAVQTVVNSTTQAFQGIQQFASNLGTQFQNTLSGLTGQQQLSAQPTTARPPGPIQSFVNNVFGGNNATAQQQQQQQQQQPGPLQGIINFLGGNRPQNTPAAPIAAVTEAAVNKPDVDDKLETGEDLGEQPAESENEVRNSAEAIDDSFEEAVPANEVILVNDDPADAAPALADPAPNSAEAEPQPAAVADADADADANADAVAL